MNTVKTLERQMKRRNYAVAHAQIGWSSPQLQVQITPLQWHIAIGISTYKLALALGPVAIAVWFRDPEFVADYYAGVQQ